MSGMYQQNPKVVGVESWLHHEPLAEMHKCLLEPHTLAFREFVVLFLADGAYSMQQSCEPQHACDHRGSRKHTPAATRRSPEPVNQTILNGSPPTHEPKNLVHGSLHVCKVSNPTTPTIAWQVHSGYAEPERPSTQTLHSPKLRAFKNP